MPKTDKDFAVFILTYGRPDRQFTVASIRKAGYTGPIYFLVSTDDNTAGELKKVYGAENVFTFDKSEIAKRMDLGDNFKDQRAVVYARNAIYDIAKGIGLKYLLILDDDYTGWQYRMDNQYRYIVATPRVRKNLDRLFEAHLNFYKSIEAKTVAMAQSGDFLLGCESPVISDGFKARRKAMNTFFVSVDKPINFVGRINEDLTTAVIDGMKGNLWLTVYFISVVQKETQGNPGGLTDIYLNLGTYVKSFYSVMYAPSCVRIYMMGNKHRRLHHRVSWDYAVPKIVSERLMKHDR